jgi:large subunit ribosomal protein L23
MEGIILEKVKATEKIVRQIELDNMISFIVDKKVTKEDIRKEVEDLFGVKVAKVRTLIKANKKQAFVKLKKEFSAGDLATKIGVL